MRYTVENELAIYAQLKSKLRAEFPDTEEQTLLDTLEGLTDLHEMLAELLRSRLNDTAFTKALRERQRDMQERLNRLEARADKKRDIALSVMDRAGIRKLEAPDFTVSLRAGTPSLQVSSEEGIPGEYWKPQPAKLDRQALFRDLKNGTEIEGASLNNGNLTLSIRTK